MKTKWLLQDTCLPFEKVNCIFEAVKRCGVEFRPIGVIPFSEHLDVPDDIDEFTIPYGSTTLIRWSRPEWKGLFFNPDRFRTSEWQRHRQDLLNQGGIDMTLRQAAQYVGREAVTDWFIRPDSDLKTFTGEVKDTEEIVRFAADVAKGGYPFDDSLKVIVSEPVNIAAEWRCFIVGGRVVTVSRYRKDGRKYHVREDDPTVLDQMRTMADIWLPESCCCMDVARLYDGNYKIIEFNCINASGFYAIDLDRLVVELTRYVDGL